MRSKSAGAADSLPPEYTELRQALRNFKRLGLAGGLRLAHEVALTRGRELCLAYSNLVSVSSGYRTRREGSGGTPQLYREPCIGFIVGRKWSGPGRADNPQALPRHLYAFGTFEDKRQLCAIPTDVRARRDYGRPVPHDGSDDVPFGILVDSASANDFASGVVTCAIQRPAVPSAQFAMSCRHVMSCTDLVPDPDESDLPVLLDTAARPALGRSTALRGRLGDNSAYSFDAQLATLKNSQALALLAGGLAFDGGASYATEPSEIGTGFWIATGRADAAGKRLLVWVDYQDTVQDFEMTYEIGGRPTTVVHRMVLHGRPESELQDGDSGAPAMRVRRGQRLIGMYIGGSKGHAYVIPAWQLMTPSNFGKPAEAGWQLI
jgi:hypothetical protein